MDRTSRLIVIVSAVFAGVTHVWLVNWQPGLGIAASVSFAASLVLARVSPRLALSFVLAFTFTAPALLALLFGRADYHYIIVWLAALGGTLVARADLQTWTVPAEWRAPLSAWAMIIALTWPVVTARELDFSLLAARTLQTTNPLLDLAPRAAAAYVVLLALTQLIGILWIDFLFAQFARRVPDLARRVIAPLVASAVCGSLVGIYQRLVDVSWMNAPEWANMQRAGGLMLDANPFGTGAALLAPLAAASAWHFRQHTWLWTAAVVILTGGMWAAGSRTALVVFMIGMTMVAIATLRERGLWREGLGWMLSGIALAGLVIAAAVVPRDFTSSNPLERAFARVPAFETAEIQRFTRELWERFGYGTAAAQMITEHPGTGIGVGAFYVVAPGFVYRETGRKIASDNAQNWWRQQLAELGVLGAAPALWTSVLIAMLCLPNHPVGDRRSATVLRATLAGLGLISLFGIPTHNPAILLVFGSVVFWLADLSTERLEAAAPAAPRAIRAALWVLIGIVVAGTAWTARADLRVPVRAARLGVAYSYGVSPPQEVSAFGGVHWMATHAVSVLPAERRWLRLTVWAPYADVAKRPVTLDVRIDGERSLAREMTAPGPVTLFIEASSPATMLELRSSRELMPDRALQIATSWSDGLTHSVPEDRVLRRSANDR